MGSTWSRTIWRVPTRSLRRTTRKNQLKAWKRRSKATTLWRCERMFCRAWDLGLCTTRKSTTKNQKDKTFVVRLEFRWLERQQRRPYRSKRPTLTSCRGSTFEPRQRACPSSGPERRGKAGRPPKSLTKFRLCPKAWRQTTFCRVEGPRPNRKSRLQTTRQSRCPQNRRNQFLHETWKKIKTFWKHFEDMHFAVLFHLMLVISTN